VREKWCPVGGNTNAFSERVITWRAYSWSRYCCINAGGMTFSGSHIFSEILVAMSSIVHRVQVLQGHFRRAPIHQPELLVTRSFSKSRAWADLHARFDLALYHQFDFGLRLWFSSCRRLASHRQWKAEFVHRRIACCIGPRFKKSSVCLQLFEPFRFIIRHRSSDGMMMGTLHQ